MRTPLKLSVQLDEPAETINIGRVHEVTVSISHSVNIRIHREGRETYVLCDTEVSNPEGPWPTRTETECVFSMLHAEGR
jgi:hypothetical protein